ncbi:hypothetical protein AAG570_013435 [Ranatra chinensis]|uniref:Lactate/malate dehydrogenase C-terminal domain-containing protein n=1 Tax=Ranatra chinensis TaxID=642074 RepID=A0ABD0YCF6_9HEMI
MLPIACEMYKRTILSVDPRRMFGVTTLDTVRGSTFVSEVLQISPDCVQVPVIGGHSPNSLVPVLSHIKPCIDLTTEETVRITRAIQEAGCESDRGKPKPRTSTLSGAFAIARFVTALAKGLAGQAGVVECSYVMSNVIPTISYLSTQVELGPDGVQKNLGVPEITDYECCLMETALPFIKSDILKGEEFTAKSQK